MRKILLVMAAVLTACQGPVGPQGGQGPVAPVLQPTAVQDVVATWQAQNPTLDPVEPGLICTLYTVPNMPANPCLVSGDVTGCTAISSSIGYAAVGPAWVYTGTIDQPNQSGTAGFDILPTNLQKSYATNFALTCTGYIVSTDDNYHRFDVDSDDGALLYIDGSLVVQNDGEHAIQDAAGTKFLTETVHTIKIMYFQAPGNVGLIVNEDGTLMPAANLYH